MKYWVKILPIFLTIFLSSRIVVLARSGCCSHHGGVCGCRCCDGTALSSTCAPYYPSCNSEPVIKPTSIPAKKQVLPNKIPTKVPTRPPAATPTEAVNLPTNIPTLIPTETLEWPKITPSSMPTETPYLIVTAVPTNNPQVMGVSASETNPSEGSPGGVVVLTGIGYLGYKLVKKRKNKENGVS